MLTNDGKDWYIEDLSDQHSTMIRVSKKTKLQTGDIIALGNRLLSSEISLLFIYEQSLHTM